MPAVNGVGEPCAGEPHARFEVAGTGNGADLAKDTGVAQPTGKPAATKAPGPKPNLRDPEGRIPTLSCRNVLAGKSFLYRKLARYCRYDQLRRPEFALVSWSGHVARSPVDGSGETAAQRTH